MAPSITHRRAGPRMMPRQASTSTSPTPTSPWSP